MNLPQILYDCITWIEGLTALIALIYYPKVKNQYWKYFSIYLIIIFLCEVFGKWGNLLIDYNRGKFFNYFVIPLEYIFFYWLYASKSFEKPKLFYALTGIYLFTFIPNELFFNTGNLIFSFNYTFGGLILMGLVIYEFHKQVNSKEILSFSRNKMFFINIGVMLFYIGTMPFWTFHTIISQYKDIWNIYYCYFQISLIVMYILFSVSIIRGKNQHQ